MKIEHEINQALALRDHWMQVPHKCGLTDCPGDLNRRKLEMWEEMLESIADLRDCSMLMGGSLTSEEISKNRDREKFWYRMMESITRSNEVIAKAKEFK